MIGKCADDRVDVKISFVWDLYFCLFCLFIVFLFLWMSASCDTQGSSVVDVYRLVGLDGHGRKVV